MRERPRTGGEGPRPAGSWRHDTDPQGAGQALGKYYGPGGVALPGPALSREARALEAEADASRGDCDRLHADVLPHADLRVVVGVLDEAVGHGAVGHHVTGRPVEHEARSEAVREGHVEFRAEELALTLRGAGLERLAAEEAGLETATRHDVGVGVNLGIRPVRRDAGAYGEGRRPRVAGLQACGD